MVDFVELVDEGVVISRDGRVFRECTQMSRGAEGAYRCVSLKGIKRDVHRLVAKAFIDNPDNKPIVMHIDDNPSNNHADNLKWGTYKDNLDDMRSKGRNKLWKKCDDNTKKVLELLEAGHRQRDIIALLDLSEGRISQIAARLIAEHKLPANYKSIYQYQK